jgi:hypothetical protein
MLKYIYLIVKPLGPAVFAVVSSHSILNDARQAAIIAESLFIFIRPFRCLQRILLYLLNQIMGVSVVFIGGIDLMSHSWGTGLPCGLPSRRTGHNPPRGPNADWWLLTTANVIGSTEKLDIINLSGVLRQ